MAIEKEDVIVDEEAAFEEPQEEKTSEEEIKDEPEEKEEDSKDRRSAIAQKRHWREKAETNSKRVQELEAELSELRSAVKKPTDDQEAKAQEYIRRQAREVYEELQTMKQKEEAQRLAKFDSEVADLLDENPDVSETELLDTIEEYEVDPKVALKILQKQGGERVKKPKMPVAKRAAAEVKSEKPDDSKKSMWDILREETAKLKK